MKTALCFSILMLPLFAGNSLAQIHPICGFARQPGPNLVLAGDAAGNLLIGDQANRVILKRTPAGATSTVAQELGAFHDIALDNNGNLFIAEHDPPRIRKVTPEGVVSTYAGNGKVGNSGDGGPAIAAPLCTPNKVAVDSAGNLFINFGVAGADSLDGDFRIRKVSPSGVITTFAGGGSPPSGPRGTRPGTPGIPDGRQATSMPFLTTNLAAGDNANNLYVATPMVGSMVRKISPSGVIMTIAGKATSGFSGDGGPATSAELGTLTAMAVDSGGNLYFAEFEGRIRKVNAAGIITTIAGAGLRGFGGQDGPAASAEFATTTDLAFDGAGNLFVSETTGAQPQGNPRWARRIRKITPAGTISTVYTRQ